MKWGFQGFRLEKTSGLSDSLGRTCSPITRRRQLPFGLVKTGSPWRGPPGRVQWSLIMEIAGRPPRPILWRAGRAVAGPPSRKEGPHGRPW